MNVVKYLKAFNNILLQITETTIWANKDSIKDIFLFL